METPKDSKHEGPMRAYPIGDDPLRPEQHDLDLIDSPGAWARMPAGAPAGRAEITVAVIDLDGIDPGHPDLIDVLGDERPKLRANHDFVRGGPQQARDLLGPHGTRCAAAAVGGFQDGVGIAGLAGDCHLVGARISDTAAPAEIADIWRWAAGLPTRATNPRFPPRLLPGADVILNAWSVRGPLHPELRAAIEEITTHGRGGRGCVMCFSAGNWGDGGPPSAAAEHERAIGVGASVNVDATLPALVDTRACYSPAGEIDLVAPSSTTAGDAPQDMVTTATGVSSGGGTSHAASLVAGAAALVLSINPELTWCDVREILRRSATRIDFQQEDLDGQWIDRDGDGVCEFSRWYGYGRLNVAEAVRMAQTYQPTEQRPGPDQTGPFRKAWRRTLAALIALTLLVALAALALGASACGGGNDATSGSGSGSGSGSQQPISSPCDLPRRASSDFCTGTGCGSNGRYLSGFVIDGLNVDGCRNYDGVRVEPGSLRRGTASRRCPEGPMKLDLVGGELVGRDPATGRIVCPADAMAGATFTVDGPAVSLGLGDSEEVRTRELRIRSTGAIDASSAEAPDRVRTYAFESPGWRQSEACLRAPAWIEHRTDSPLAAPFDPALPTPAVLVIGELYDPRSAEVKPDVPGAGRWFNVGCAGSALSKMRLLGLDPTRSSSTPDERQATLKMITAKYCGGTSYTEAGISLRWESRTGKTAQPPAPSDPIEARWTARGASCISHSRAWRHGHAAPVFPDVPSLASEAALIEHVRTRCQIPACSGSPGAGTGPDKVYWTTYAVDHIPHGAGDH